MLKYSGGHEVDMGTYWNARECRIVELKNGGILPGDGSRTYYRVPFGILFLIGIATGGLYVVLLPVIIISMSFYYLGKRVLGDVLVQVRRSVSFGWRPTEAYLAGRNKREKKNGGTKER